MKSEQILQLFFKEKPFLQGYLLAATRDYHSTEDILQEISLILVRKAGDYDSTRPFKPWLNGIARRELASWLRKQKSRMPVLDPETLDYCNAALESLLEDDSIHRRTLALQKCLSSISGTGRKILDLRYHDRRTCGQIARKLNRSLQSVYAILKRAKALLQRCVETRMREMLHEDLAQ